MTDARPSRAPIASDSSHPAHGTNGGYCNHGCRCDGCTEAHRAYHREYMATSPRQARLRDERAAARLPKVHKAPVALAPPRVVECGTTAGFHRHRNKLHEEPCDACREAKRLYERERARRRRRDDGDQIRTWKRNQRRRLVSR